MNNGERGKINRGIVSQRLPGLGNTKNTLLFLLIFCMTFAPFVDASCYRETLLISRQ